MTTDLIKKQEAAQLTGLSEHTLKSLRLKEELIEGMHWIRVNAKSIRYRRSALQHWIEHRHDPTTHLRFLETLARQTS
jgi:predicted DNA-binding transcriptional regulator AlpA